MKKDAVLRILRTNEAMFRRDYFVKSLALFGSVARDEAGPDSDVDLLVEFARPTGYFGLVRLQLLLEQLLACPVDLGTPGSLRPNLRQRIDKEAIRVVKIHPLTPDDPQPASAARPSTIERISPQRTRRAQREEREYKEPE
jgi:uncharacterized protein